MRIGVSARLAKTAAAALGDKDPHDIELMWPGLAPPYLDLFAWLEGRAEKPVNRDPAPFRPVMLAHAIEDADFTNLDAADFIAEWKWDGIRVQAVSGRDERGHMQARLYSRTGEDITKSFPDLVPSLHLPGAIDGELLVLRDGRVQTFNVLQQRLNRKVVSPKLMKDFPIHLRAYDLLGDDENDLRELPFAERRAQLETFVKKLDDPSIDLSPTVAFDSWDALTAARADPASAGAGEDAEAVEGVMLKRRDAPYLPGRPKGQWWKWKRDPHLIDAVLMYAQRGHGKRSSFYSDYTFGVWTNRRGRRAAGAGRKGLFRLHRRGAAADRPLRPPQHHRKIRPCAACRARAGSGAGAGSRLRGAAALAAAQIRRRDALSPHQPAALGQAAARGRPAGDAGTDVNERDRKLRFPAHVSRRPLTATMHGFPMCPAVPYNAARPMETTMPNDVRDLPASNDGLYRFLGGSPLAVAFRLILLSILVGVVLAAIGFDPWNILNSIRLLFQRLWDLGFDAINWLWRYFLLGAVIVIPIWLLSRLFGTPRGR